MVAPNSLRLRAKAKMTPVMIPGIMRGMVTVKNTRSGPAPKVRAAASKPSSTCSMERRIARTRRGKATTAEATAAPFQLNIKLIPRFSYSQVPIIPLRPSRTSSRYPITTGGKTRGRCVNPSSSVLPINFLRARSQAMNTPGGRMAITAHIDIQRLSLRASFSSGVNASSSVTSL